MTAYSTQRSLTNLRSVNPLSMNEVTTYRWSFDEDLHRYEQAGYEGIGVWLRKVRDFGEERAIELLSESRLRVSNVVWAGGFTGSDGVSVKENISETRRALQLAGAMRAGALVVYSGGRNNHTERHAQRLLRTSLDQLLPHAERARTPIAIEPMHPACANEWSILTCLEKTLDLVKEYDTPWLRLVFDTYHFPLAEHRWDWLEELAPYLAVVHLGDIDSPHSGDLERCPLGTGQAPINGIVQTLRQAGYDGFFDVELMGSAVDEVDYERLLTDSRQAFAAALEAKPLPNATLAA